MREKAPKYTPEIAKAVCDLLTDGMSLRKVCKQLNVAKSTILDWRDNNINGFGVQYTRAREIGYLELAEDLLEISDDGSNDWIASNDPENPGYKLNGEHVQRSRLRTDTRKWLLSKMLPKVYGDKTAVEHSGSLNIASLIEGSYKTPE